MNSESPRDSEDEMQGAEAQAAAVKKKYDGIKAEYEAMGCAPEEAERFAALIKRLDDGLDAAIKSRERAEVRAREVVGTRYGVIHYPRDRFK